MSHKGDREGLTEHTAEHASWTRRRNEAAERQQEPTDHQAQSEATDSLTQLWLRHWPGCRPIGHELRFYSPERWVRFHSFPESNRYSDDEDEYAEMLRRHHAVISELQANRYGPGELVVITVERSFNDEIEPRPTELEEVLPSTRWTSVLRERDGDDEYWTHLFVSRVASDAPAFDRLLRLAADDIASDVIITDAELNWLYHPYDGGADVIASSTAQRDELRAAQADWLTTHPQGL